MSEDLKPNLEPLEGRIVSGNYELTCVLSMSNTGQAARQLRITGIIFSDEDVKAVTQRVNNAQDVLDLQQVRMDIVVKEAQKAQQAYALEASKDQMAQLLDKQKKGRKLTSAEQTQLRNMDTALVKGKEILASFDAAIAAARAKLNGAAPAA